MVARKFDPEAAFDAIRRAHEAECRVVDCVPDFSPWVQVAVPAAALFAMWLFVASGASAWLRTRFSGLTRRRWLQATLFAPLLVLWVGLSLLPVRWWLEKVVGLSNGPRFRVLDRQGRPVVFPERPFSDWAWDKIDDLIGPAMLLALVLPLAMWIVRHFPRRWWIAAATVASISLVSDWIDRASGNDWQRPGFEVVAPLPDGPLGDDLRDIAVAGGLPPSRLLVGQQNVFNFGLGAEARLWNGRQVAILGEFFFNILPMEAKKITDFRPMSAVEVRATAGHEIAHVKLNHAIVLPLIWLCSAWMLAALAYLGARELLLRFGSRWRVGGADDLAAAPIVALCLWAAYVAYYPVRSASQLLMEHRADAVGLDIARDPDGMIALAVRIARAAPLDWPVAGRLFFTDHPLSGERIRRAIRWKADNAPARWRATGQSGPVRFVRRPPT